MIKSADSNLSPLKQWPFLLWIFNIFVCFVFFSLQASLTIILLSGLASVLSFFRHKASFTISAMLWLFVTFQTGLNVSENILWLLPVMSATCAFLTFYFTQFPYVNSRTNLLGRGDRVDYRGIAVLRSDDLKFTAEVESISSSGMSIRGNFNLKMGDIIDVEILELQRFKTKAKVVGGTSPLLRLQFVGLSFGSVAEHLKVRQHVRKTIKSKAGYSLIEVMLVAGVGSILMLAANQLFMSTSNMEKTAQTDFWIENFKNDIISNIRDPAAWKNTLSAPENTTATCLRDKTPCWTKNLTGPLSIYSSNGKIIFDSTQPNTGFTSKGNLCADFDTGKNDCQFRFNILWTPVCSGSCINPDVKIDIVFVSKSDGRRVAMNSNTRSLTFYRTPIYDSVEETCTSIGGIFSAANGNCVWTRLDAACTATGQVLVGFDANGQPICENFPARDCAAGTWLVGFQANGDLICEAR